MHVLLDSNLILGGRTECYLFRFILDIFAEELFVEGVIFVIVFTQRYIKPVVPRTYVTLSTSYFEHLGFR